MRLLSSLALAAVMASGTTVFAVGDDDETPPQPTKTTIECEGDQIFDAETETCVDADKQSFNDDDRYDAVRELAYAGAYDRARMVIAAADNARDARFLNYKGFVARMEGKMDIAVMYYAAALRADPDYILARSYMGQGLVQMGDKSAAKAQLSEIAARGGAGTWAHTALANAIIGRAVPTY